MSSMNLNFFFLPFFFSQQNPKKKKERNKKGYTITRKTQKPTKPGNGNPFFFYDHNFNRVILESLYTYPIKINDNHYIYNMAFIVFKEIFLIKKQ